jgi:hypothetical protein
MKQSPLNALERAFVAAMVSAIVKELRGADAEVIGDSAPALPNGEHADGHSTAQSYPRSTVTR